MAIKFDDTGEVVGTAKKSKVVFDSASRTPSDVPFSVQAKLLMEALPQTAMARSVAQNPQRLLPAVGMAALSPLGPPGIAAGAGLGQIGSRMVDIAKGSPVQSPMKEAIGPMVQTALAGLPYVSRVGSLSQIPFKKYPMQPGEMTLAERAMRAYDKAGETLSGAKRNILKQARQQGYSTYKAPSLPKAQELFGKALGPEGQAAMKQAPSEVFDSQLGQARQTAVEVATKIEKGEPVTAVEALKARQATDRVISATSEKDKMARDALFEWRGKFDDVMTQQSGPLKGVSNLYRRAIVKDVLTEPTRITKSGRPSAFLPLVLGAGGRGLSGVLSGLAGTSPALWGLGATTMGEINPIMAQALLASVVQRMTEKKKPISRKISFEQGQAQ